MNQSYIQILCLALLLTVIKVNVLAQIPPGDSWHQLDPKEHKVNGVSIDRANKLIEDRIPTTVVVAIIDSGVDILHEDLQHAIWVNVDEFPDNGLDDDGNGYIDDVHGWNFIGGDNGKNVNHETLEITRLYGKLHPIWKDVHPEDVKKRDQEEYELYLHAVSEVEKHRTKLLNAIKPIETEEQIILSAFRSLSDHLQSDSLDLVAVKAIKEESSPLLALGKQIVIGLTESDYEFYTYSEIEEVAKKEYAQKTETYRRKLDYSFNHEYNSRVSIVGDDYEDSYQRIYGNNDVTGPDSFHGTHVSGIVAANRSNDTGIKGIAEHTLIMPIRTVPDGDERDKDVANAIIYAVDNGASIINMSFGKYYSWDKEVVDFAIRYAEKKDVLIIHAAGNNSRDIGQKVHFPTDQYDKSWFLSRKKAKNWIEVGALSWQQNEKAVASFSNYGDDDVDVFAPGVAIRSTAPENKYAIASGTSMAAPVVAGVAAMLRSYFPNLTAEQIKEILIQSAIQPPYKVSQPGDSKLINLDEISVSGGMVNAYTAMKLAIKTKGKKKIKSKEVPRP